MKLKTIVILGGDVTGCVVAASLSHALQKTGIEIRVLDIGSSTQDSQTYDNFGVETLSPQTQVFHETLGLDEAQVLALTQGTFSFGSRFLQWQKPGSGFVQTYDNHGVDFNHIGFQHFYVKFREQLQQPAFDKFSLSAAAALRNRFSHPSSDQRSVISTLNYGLNLASKPYSQLLREYSERHGVKFSTGTFVKAIQNDDATVKQIVLDGGIVEGDFFIDCSGSQSLLMRATFGIAEVDWSSCLPYNRRADFIQPRDADLPSTSSFTAYSHGWLKSVALRQHNINSLIFSADYLNEDDAGKIVAREDMEIRQIAPGHKAKLWHGNVIAFGEAALNLEQFTFSKMDVLYQNIKSFLNLLPADTRCPLNAGEYNRVTVEHYEQLKDYHLCHQLPAQQQTDSGFWRACRSAPLSEALQQRLELFRGRGIFVPRDGEIIPAALWVSLLLGCGILPEDYDPRVDIMNSEDLVGKIQRMQMIIERTVEKLPKHSDYLERYLHSRG